MPPTSPPRRPPTTRRPPRPPVPPLPRVYTPSYIAVPLPVAPYLTHLPSPPPTFTTDPRCQPTSGRLIFTPNRTHKHLPNLCRQWTCWYCATYRVHRLLELLALHHEHDRRNADPSIPFPHLTLHQLPPLTLQRRVDRAGFPVSRLTITRATSPTATPRQLSITSHYLGDPGPGGLATEDLPTFFDVVSATAFPLPGITRVRWSGTWSDTAPDHIPVEIPLRDVPRHILPSVLDLAVDAAVKRWGCRAWSPLSDALPRQVPDAWWFRELRRSAELFT